MPSEKVTFDGHGGGKLAARLEIPNGPVRATVLFAHCFTCSKDSVAAVRITRRLAEIGFGVLRFDFTGLGDSEGDFANTHFSSNVEDLLCAADYLRERLSAPAILVGHSLGGAAVLAAATRIPEVRAVATLAAPSSAEHVVENFAQSLEQIEQDGEANVSLGGRPFTIKRSFIEDARQQTLLDSVARMKKALLVLHAPLDETVSVSNATDIFVAAKHPKSFVSLDGADHLLRRTQDAIYAADVIAAWAGKYLEAPGEPAAAHDPAPAPADGAVRVTETGDGIYEQRVTIGHHTLTADEPVAVGGTDKGPTPYDLLAAGLGACTTITLRMYAERKGLPLENVTVDVSHDKIHVDDCETCTEDFPKRVDRFKRAIKLTGPLTTEQRNRLLEIADKCPVHRTLEAKSVVETTLL
ncbi:MAG: bifunctional alpha/beta hydrolase/OsmC family protein [Pseudomonadota bacterium]